MKKEEIEKSLVFFQSNSFKIHKSLGFTADNYNSIFGIIIEMRNIILSAEKEDTILVHHHMAKCANHIANYATIHSIFLKDVISNNSYEEMLDATVGVDLEYYLEKIKDDLGFVKDMKEDHKKEFIQKVWVAIFPEDYQNNFIKIDRILKKNVEDNKIKYPQNFQ